MKFKNILLLYKKSSYQIYFVDGQSANLTSKNRVVQRQLKRFKSAHVDHYKTLTHVKQILDDHKLSYRECCRGNRINYAEFDLIITVGGDGTFLEAAKEIGSQVILGVNSSRAYSVGQFCRADMRNFEKTIKKIISGKFTIDLFHRIRLMLKSEKRSVDVLNDILVCHSNPAMLSRYDLQVGKRGEVQQSSGVWVATAMGSTGAMRSAGGKVLASNKKIFQYLPRELNEGVRKRYKLRGGLVRGKEQIKIVSLMRRGVIYVDGAHTRCPFDIGSIVEIKSSPNPVRTIRN